VNLPTVAAETLRRRTACSSSLGKNAIGDPAQQGVREALAAGRTMRRRFSLVATRWQRDRSIAIRIGIGLHLGVVALGLLGPPGRRTVILVEDTANVAARLCSRARKCEVLFLSTVAAALDAGTDLGPIVGRAAFLYRRSSRCAKERLGRYWVRTAASGKLHRNRRRIILRQQKCFVHCGLTETFYGGPPPNLIQGFPLRVRLGPKLLEFTIHRGRSRPAQMYATARSPFRNPAFIECQGLGRAGLSIANRTPHSE
jgi:hypothetical protein